MRRVKQVTSSEKLIFAREQRQPLTAAEELLWRHIRADGLGAKFRRQHPIGDFVLDFYCDEYRLAVEVDGPEHQTARKYDEWRDGELAKSGIRVLRIPADEALHNTKGVLELIRRVLTP